ncbi:ribosomal protein L15, putative (macronuclear) [Tetrahymena thermophila SB210]|uniref:Ribosomal protein L15, putative n=1 Tax=Tetrahymena thermophila (strain SB210) TaxID=312017 RepID=I7MF78_TETTS|nr:ribosomal protein L15, putative [Tetrahymena thermophila SB210]EAR99460.1 ribosomal protein L15, putative [Tetrahymena thermophila SB210]6Z1P_Aq Chain Aq, Ribosomal protein L15, putative [Tetrahymena thermophila SB210]|eukprot:XP_001019705.1 ribosomal protein L15, putative [Tetrahymena thermophila SB210]
MNLLLKASQYISRNSFPVNNIRSLLQGSVYSFSSCIKQRPNDVPTHRNELLPFTLNNLWNNPGYRRKAKKLGRGIGSGKGKTAGKGTNGHNSRSGGGVSPRFEGGQTPWFRRLPKLGITRINKERPKAINMSLIMYAIHKGRIDSTKPITIKVLHDAGVFSTAKYGVKLVGRGLKTIDRPLHFEVSDASENVIKAIKEKGGSVKCIYRTPLQIREHVFPQNYPINLRSTIPPKRIVKKMENIRERGAEVEFNVPKWHEQNVKEILEDKKIKEEEFNLPVPRFPGSGKDKIRIRKPILPKQINFKI